MCKLLAILREDRSLLVFATLKQFSKKTTLYFFLFLHYIAVVLPVISFNHCFYQNTRYVNCKYIEDYTNVNVLKNSNVLIQIHNILNISCILYMPLIICIDWYHQPTEHIVKYTPSYLKRY